MTLIFWDVVGIVALSGCAALSYLSGEPTAGWLFAVLWALLTLWADIELWFKQ